MNSCEYSLLNVTIQENLGYLNLPPNLADIKCQVTTRVPAYPTSLGDVRLQPVGRHSKARPLLPPSIDTGEEERLLEERGQRGDWRYIQVRNWLFRDTPLELSFHDSISPSIHSLLSYSHSALTLSCVSKFPLFYFGSLSVDDTC